LVLQAYAVNNDKFFDVTTFNGKVVTLYAMFGNIYKPDCVRVNEIEVISINRSQNSDSKCFADLPVRFLLNGKWLDGFLTNNLVIKLYSSERDCGAKFFRFIWLNGAYRDSLLRINNREVTLVHKKNLHLASFNYINSASILISRLNHSNIILDGVDMMANFEAMVRPSSEVGNNTINSVGESVIQNVQTDTMESWIDSLEAMGWKIVYIVVSIFSFFLFCFLLFLFVLDCVFWALPQAAWPLRVMFR
jgi:hypothetical protein